MNDMILQDIHELLYSFIRPFKLSYDSHTDGFIDLEPATSFVKKNVN